MHRSLLTGILASVLLFFAYAPPAEARRPIRKAFFNVHTVAETTRLDELASNASHCGVCHFDFDGGGTRNPYGVAVEVALNSGSFASDEDAIASLALPGIDSDNDGFDNVVEIEDLLGFSNTPTFPGLKTSSLGSVSNVTISEIDAYLTPTGSTDTTPPTVTILSPVGGESIAPNQTFSVQWTATDDTDVARIDLQFSDDGGVTFKTVAVALANDGSHDWFVPNMPGSDSRIRVVGVDVAGNIGDAISPASFTVTPWGQGTVPTTLRDFELPGTQPFEGGIYEDPSVSCVTCHGGYDTAVEPYANWQGSMMSQAMRDPLYLATLVIAEQDAPASGDLCIRCHTPGGWQEGRSADTSTGMINAKDRQGVQCDFCHRAVDPIYEAGVSPAVDADILAASSSVPLQPANGQWIADPDPVRRGPYADAQASHLFLESPFHRSADMCATCHDVSNPVFESAGDGATYFPGLLDAEHPDGDLRNMFPVERTSSEWSQSAYANGGVFAPQFAGDKPDGIVSTCQDCHMPDTTGAGSNEPGSPTRTDLPMHDFAGGNYFIPDLLDDMWPGEVDVAALASSKAKALAMLQKAATLDLISSVVDGQLTLTTTVTNETGHKLPSGYPEGRRVWLQVKAFDDQDALVYESGAYDASTGVLTEDEDAKIYEIKPGVSTRLSALLGIPAGESFHFVLNDTLYGDNRIPPRGFTNAAFTAIQSPPVNYTYADGQYSDATTYTLPSSARRVEARLLYQTTSKEYIEFLRDENVTDSQGQDLYDAWVANGRCAPAEMAFAELTLDVTPVPEAQRWVTSLREPYPNPFNPRTQINFVLATAGRASLRVYDTRGRLVRTLADGQIGAGEHRAIWEGVDRAGRAVASGLYFAVLESKEGIQRQKLTLVR